MEKIIEYFIANPAGNITAFVVSSVERENYKVIANKLFEIRELGIEQVGFIKDDKMEMCGQEFCGNASRSYGLYLAKQKNLKGEHAIEIKVSGSDTPLQVIVNTDTNYTKIEMPLPVKTINYKGVKSGLLIDFEGIMHLILNDVPADDKLFEILKKDINDRYAPPAMGVMFYDSSSETLTPVVYVKDVDTTYYEGSCGSGSTALACALSDNLDDGCYVFSIKQPAGTIIASTEVKNKKIHKVFIEGPVDLSEIFKLVI